ncbi:hypothetical protein [Halobiforma nitratireducens]|uniref:hypothetical protein n=1 Tax=Halobiforma nitratireducens TaxID=130048 RepID=UPI0014616370|nr:hypothetical protein [Halobiforma nitratireducens]
MPRIPDFPPTSDDDEETDDNRHRGGIIDRIIDGGVPTTSSPEPTPAVTSN